MATESELLNALAKEYGIDKVYQGNQVIIDGISYTAKPLSLAEARIWTAELDTLIAPVKTDITSKKLIDGTLVSIDSKTIPVGNIAGLLREKVQHLYMACMASKVAIDGQLLFTGFYAKPGEMGWRHIKPCDVMRSTAGTETPVDTWEFAFANNDDYWIGWNTNNTTKIDVDKNICVCAIGLATSSANFNVEQVKFTQNTQEQNPIQLKPLMAMADAIEGKRVMGMKTLFAKARALLLAQSYSFAANTCELMLVGVTYGDGKYLTDFTKTSVEL